MTQPTYATINEVAEILNVHRNTVARWIRDGQLPYVTTPGGHPRIDIADIVHPPRDDDE